MYSNNKTFFSIYTRNRGLGGYIALCFMLYKNNCKIVRKVIKSLILCGFSV
nr:MAG TPA: hypothetical protein [Bacteriophage sp.]